MQKSQVFLQGTVSVQLIVSKFLLESISFKFDYSFTSFDFLIYLFGYFS